MDLILTAKQFRGARSYLGLSQTELAKIVGVTKNTVSNWEKESYPIPVQKNRQIISFFLKKGIQFTPGGAFIEKEKNEMETLKGYYGLKRLYDDIYEGYAINPLMDCYVFGVLDNKVLSELQASHESLSNIRAVMKKKIKVIYNAEEETVSHEYPDLCEYKRVGGARLSGMLPTYLFADKVATVDWKKREIVCIKNDAVVRILKQEFAYMWGDNLENTTVV